MIIILLILICALIGAYLGALGGADNSSCLFRRLGIPIMLSILALTKLHNLYAVMLMVLSAPLSMGYGIPDLTDEGSVLGRFWMNIFQNETRANIATRGTNGLLICLISIIIPIINGNWLPYIIASLMICMATGYISWQNFGEIKVFGKELSIVELITYFIICWAIAGVILL